MAMSERTPDDEGFIVLTSCCGIVKSMSANLQGGVDRSRFYAASAISVLMRAELSLTLRTPIFQEGTTGASLD